MSYKIQSYTCRLVRDGRPISVDREKIRCFDDAAAFFRDITNLPHEEVWIVLVDGQNRVTGRVMVSRGGMHACAIRPVDVLRPIIISGASGFVMAHNHPSGDSTPSADDILMTRNLKMSADAIGVFFLGHIVMGSGGVNSVPGF